MARARETEGRRDGSPGRARGEDCFLVLDVETANRAVRSICQIGVVRVVRGRDGWAIVDPVSILVDPGGPFEFTRIHGLAARHVRGHPDFGGHHAALAARLAGEVVVAHSGFDRAALGAACAHHGRPELACRWVDSIRVARAAWPGLPSYGLAALAERHGLTFRHHDGLEDAAATARIVIRALEETGRRIEDWLPAG